MTEFVITIKAGELAGAIRELAAALKPSTAVKQEGPAAVPAKEPDTLPDKAPDPLPEKAPEKAGEPAVTLQQVKAMLVAKAQEGKNTEAKALVAKYGAKKVTDVDPEKYADLLKEAESL